MLQLRDYQEDCKQQVYDRFNQGDRAVFLQLATGGGKTPLAAAFTLDAIASGKKLLFTVYRQELAYQAVGTLERLCNVPVGLVMGGVKPSPLYPIQVGMLQSLSNRDLPHADVIILDEAHKYVSTYRRLLAHYPESRKIGLSATPIRTDGTGFDDVYQSLVQGVSTRELIDRGYLSKFKLMPAKSLIELNGVKIDRSGDNAGDYNSRELAEEIDIEQLAVNIVAAYKENVYGKKNLVYAPSVEHSKAIALAFNRIGIPAVHLDGTTSRKDRREALIKYIQGEYWVLSNYDLFGEGLDLAAYAQREGLDASLADIEVVQCARPTASLALWLQMCGRCLRAHFKKLYAFIIDHTRNHRDHGKPDRKRLWTLEGVTDAGQKIRQFVRNGEVVEEEEDELKLQDRAADLAKLKPTIKLVEEFDDDTQTLEYELQDLTRLIEIAKHKTYKKGWVANEFAKLEPSLAGLQACALRLGYSRSWADFQFKQAELKRKFLAETGDRRLVAV